MSDMKSKFHGMAAKTVLGIVFLSGIDVVHADKSVKEVQIFAEGAYPRCIYQGLFPNAVCGPWKVEVHCPTGKQCDIYYGRIDPDSRIACHGLLYTVNDQPRIFNVAEDEALCLRAVEGKSNVTRLSLDDLLMIGTPFSSGFFPRHSDPTALHK